MHAKTYFEKKESKTILQFDLYFRHRCLPKYKLISILLKAPLTANIPAIAVFARH